MDHHFGTTNTHRCSRQILIPREVVAHSTTPMYEGKDHLVPPAHDTALLSPHCRQSQSGCRRRLTTDGSLFGTLHRCYCFITRPPTPLVWQQASLHRRAIIRRSLWIHYTVMRSFLEYLSCCSKDKGRIRHSFEACLCDGVLHCRCCCEQLLKHLLVLG